MDRSVGRSTAESSAFTVPSFNGDVDVARYMQDCPSSAMTRGVFFTSICEHAEERLGSVPERLFTGLSRRRWTQFATYPLSEFMVLAVSSARLLYPSCAMAEGLRRIGGLGFHTFAGTLAGRVLLFALGEDVEHVVTAAPKAYAQALPGAHMSARKIAERHYRLAFRNVYNFVETYHYGLIEGSFKAIGASPTIALRTSHVPGQAEFDARWL